MLQIIAYEDVNLKSERYTQSGSHDLQRPVTVGVQYTAGEGEHRRAIRWDKCQLVASRCEQGKTNQPRCRLHRTGRWRGEHDKISLVDLYIYVHNFDETAGFARYPLYAQF